MPLLMSRYDGEVPGGLDAEHVAVHCGLRDTRLQVEGIRSRAKDKI